MSNPPTSERPRAPESRARGGSLLIGTSLVFSVMLIGWAFSIPFRSGGERSVSSGSQFGGSMDLIHRVRKRRTEAEQYREMALELDADFMKSVSERRAQRNQPTHQDMRKAWNRRVTRVKREIASLREAPKGSMQWQYRQELIDSFKAAAGDGPSRP